MKILGSPPMLRKLFKTAVCILLYRALETLYQASGPRFLALVRGRGEGTRDR